MTDRSHRAATYTRQLVQSNGWEKSVTDLCSSGKRCLIVVVQSFRHSVQPLPAFHIFTTEDATALARLVVAIIIGPPARFAFKFCVSPVLRASPGRR